VFSSSALRAASLVYGNYDTTNPFQTLSGLSVVKADAVPFVANLSAPTGFAWQLSDIEFAATVSDFNTDTGFSNNLVSVSLFGTTNNLPGALLGSATVNLASNSPETQVNFGTNAPLLVQGQEYWVGLTDQITGDLTWYQDGSSTSTFGAATLSGSTWSFNPGLPEGAVRVNATLVASSVPEPGTFLALGSGLLLLLGKRRKN
jgi:hypothetical protein